MDLNHALLAWFNINYTLANLGVKIDALQLMSHPDIFMQSIDLGACMFSPGVHNGPCLGLAMPFLSRVSIAASTLDINAWT